MDDNEKYLFDLQGYLTVADALDAPVVVNAEDQGTSRGAAILALHSIGAIKSVYDLQPKVSATYRPRAEASAVLKQAAARQRELYSRTLG